MSATDEARRWLGRAEHDLRDIRNNVIGPDAPWDIVCYHAQQATEKALKAILIAHGVAPPRTHDCVRLLDASLPFEATLEQYREQCARLSGWATRNRYPDDHTDPDRGEALALASRSREIVVSIARSLGVEFTDPLDGSL